MATETSTVILDFEINSAEAFKQIAELQNNIANLRAKQKELDTSTEEGRAAYERYSAEIKIAQSQVRGLQNMQINLMKSQNEEMGYIDRLKAKNAALTAQLNGLSKADANYIQKEAELQRAILETTNELKASEQAHGDHRRSVGNYEIATKSLRQELRELTERLAMLAAAGQQNSAIYNELAQRAAVLKDAQGDVNQQIGIMASDTSQLDTMREGVNGIVQSYIIWQQMSQLVGIEDEELQKTITGLMIAMQALQAATVLQNLAQKQSNLYRVASNILQKLGIKQTTAEAVANTAATATVKTQVVAENALTVAKTKGGIAAKVAAAAQWAWNAAMAANPVAAILIVVVALIAGIVALVKVFKDSNEAADAAAAANKRYEEQAAATAARVADLNAAEKKAEDQMLISNRRRILEMQKNGASEHEIAKQQLADAEELRKLHTAAHNARIEELQIQMSNIDAARIKQVRYFKTLKEGDEEYEEARDKVREYTDAIRDLNSEIDSEKAAQQNELLDIAEKQFEQQQKIADDTYNSLTKVAEIRKRLALAGLKLQDGYYNQSFAARQQYARRIEDVEVKAEQQRLATARRFGKITASEYDAGIRELSARMENFRRNQAKEATAWSEQQRNAILALFDKTTEERIADVEERYAAALETLNSQTIAPPDRSAFDSQADYDKAQADYENFMYNRAAIALRLEQQQEKEIAKIRQDARNTEAAAIEKSIEDRYAGDLQKFEDNEREKLKIERQMLEDQKSEKQKAGLDTYAEDRALAANDAQQRELDLRRDLLLAGDNAKAIYEAKKKYLDAERKAAEGNAERQMELDNEMEAAAEDLRAAQAASIQKYVDGVSNALNALNELMSAYSDLQLEQIQAQYDQESEMLKEKLEAGYISQEEYDKKQEQLDKKLEKEQAKIQRQEAIREKAMAMFKIAVDTAMALVALWVSPGFPGAIPMMAVVGALAAVQLAAVAAQPLPKAARGRKINGKTHAQGGEIVVAEDGEIIMNKNSVRMFGPELSAMSVAGGGVPFTNAIPDGGYTARASISETMGGADMERSMARALRSLKIYTTIEDIRRGERQYSQIEQAGIF